MINKKLKAYFLQVWKKEQFAPFAMEIELIYSKPVYNKLHGIKEGWWSTYDGSIQYDEDYEGGLEIKPKRGIRTKNSIERAIKVLNNLEFRNRRGEVKVNKSCGGHIHLGIQGDLRNKVIAYAYQNKGWINRLVACRRLQNHFCEWSKNGDMHYNAYSKSHLGTLEVRLMEGTLKAEQWIHWIVFNEYLAKHAIQARRVRTVCSVQGLFKAIKLPQETVQFFLDRLN